MATIGQIHPWEITGKHLTAVKQKINDLSIPEEQMASTQLKTLHEDVEMELKSLIDYDKKLITWRNCYANYLGKKSHQWDFVHLFWTC